MPNAMHSPGLLRLLACLVYDGLVVLAWCLVLAGGFILLLGDASHGLKRYFFQWFLWLGLGSYFVWCWRKSGQTLAMQTWRIKLVNQQGEVLSWRQALARYVLASLSAGLLGLGFLWALLDRDHLFLHDRWLNTRLIFVPRAAA